MSSSTRHRSPTVERRSPLRRSTGALITLLALGYGVIHPTTAVQADTAIDVVPLHSTVEVSNLPPSSPSPALLPLLPITTKPFRTRDPAALQTWKELLQSVPGVVPQAPGMVDDPSPTVSVRAPGPSAPIITRQFEGLANSDNAALTGSTVLPPDDTLGAGPSHIFEMVNIVGRIVD